jgi:Phosphotransferase enzyme family
LLLHHPMTELPDAAVRALRQLKPEWHHAELRNVARLPGGYSNDNYAFDRGAESYVLRVVRPQSRALDRGFEHRLLSGPVGRLAAPLIAFDVLAGHMLTRRVPGALLVDAPVGVETIAGYLRHLHDHMPPLQRRYDVARVVADDLATAQAHGEPTPRWIHGISSSLGTTSVRDAPCHNDLNPWNVVVCDADPTRWCTLDWEFAGNNDPLFDVLCIAGGMDWSAGRADALIDAYFQARGQPPPSRQERHGAWLAYWLREYAWALAQRALGNGRAEIVEQWQRSLAALRRLSA